jgi:hypothetical protein
MKILLIISLLFQSCSVHPIFVEKRGIDPAFAHHVAEYRGLIGKNKYSEKFKRLHINFSNKLNDNTMAVCYIRILQGEYEILINQKMWNRSHLLSQEFTIYHELEHCIRKRMHTNDDYEIEKFIDIIETIGFYLNILEVKGYLPDGCPYSVMHSDEFSYRCYQLHYFHYKKEIKEYK